MNLDLTAYRERMIEKRFHERNAKSYEAGIERLLDSDKPLSAGRKQVLAAYVANYDIAIDAINELDKTCEHDIVLKLGKDGVKSEHHDYAVCLCCGKSMFLGEVPVIPSSFVIDVDEIIPYDVSCLYDEEGNLLVRRATRKLDELASIAFMVPSEKVTQLIIEDLVLYADIIDELESERTEESRNNSVRKRRKYPEE